MRPQPPAPNSVVLGSITRLSPLQALLSITVVDGVPLPPGEEFTGVIRSQDVRATEKDKVRIGDCFRGGDVVRGIVVRPSTASFRIAEFSLSLLKISLGDARSYFVTTARNDLGVIFATSEAGNGSFRFSLTKIYPFHFLRRNNGAGFLASKFTDDNWRRSSRI